MHCQPGAPTYRPMIQMHTGSRLRLHFEVALGEDGAVLQDPADRQYQDRLRALDWMHNSHQSYHSRMEAATANRRLRSFQVGDLVSVQRPDYDKLPCKLLPKFVGPYRIVTEPLPQTATYLVKRVGGGLQATAVHVDRIKKYEAILPDEPSDAEPSSPNPRSKRYESCDRDPRHPYNFGWKGVPGSLCTLPRGRLRSRPHHLGTRVRA